MKATFKKKLKKAPKAEIKSVAIYCHNKPNKEKVETIFIRDLVRFFYGHGIKVIHGDLRSVSLLKSSIPKIEDLQLQIEDLLKLDE